MAINKEILDNNDIDTKKQRRKCITIIIIPTQNNIKVNKRQ